MAGESLPALVIELARSRALAKKYEARKKELEKMIPELLMEQGLSSLKTDAGPQVFLKPNDVKLRAWPATEGDDKDSKAQAFLDLLREHGAGHLINDDPRVANASLCAWVKERLKSGEVIPEGIGYSTEPSMSLRLNDWSPEDV